jgi:hypothetical protein
MKVSYGVTWRATGPRHAGRLSVGTSSVTLISDEGAREIAFDRIAEVEAGDGRLVFVLEGGETVELDTTVDRWILEDLDGKVPIASAHGWHPGFGL